MIAADSGSAPLPPRMVEGEGAEAVVGLRRTIQPSEFESLQVYCGGMLPCSVDEFVNGVGHKMAFAVCRKELAEQLDRGVEGLEDTDNERTEQGSREATEYVPPHGQKLEDFPEAGARCSICGAPQFKTPSGLLCAGGHGGAASLGPGETPSMERTER